MSTSSIRMIAILDRPAVAVLDRQQTELELRVGDDDAARFGVRGAFGVEAQRQIPDAIEHALADQFGGVLLGDVDVVAALRLGRRREDRLGQPIRFAQSLRQADAAELAGRDVVLPAGARQVAARDAFDRQRLGARDEHRPALQQIGRSARFARIRRRRRSTAGDWRRSAACARTRTTKSGSAPCPCRECPSRARSRTRRCDRSRRSAGDRRTRRYRGPFPGDRGVGRRVWSGVWERRAATKSSAEEEMHLTGAPTV